MINVGIDTGGSRTRVFCTESQKYSFKTAQKYDEYLEALLLIIKDIGVIENIVIALPARIEDERPINPPNLDRSWNQYDIKKDIKTSCSNIRGTVKIVQDTEAAAFGFLKKGVVKKFPAMILTLSTGVGGAIIWKDVVKPLEIGHAVLNLSESQAKCGCGQIGCVEADLSGTAILKATGKLPEELGTEFWKEYGKMFGEFLSVFLPVFCVKEIILFGGLANQGSQFLPTANLLLSRTIKETNIAEIKVYSQYDEIGAYGAQMIAQELVATDRNKTNK